MHFIKTILKKTLVKFVISIWDEEKYIAILQNKELQVNCENNCFLYRVEMGKMTKT